MTEGLEARRAWLDMRQAQRCQHREAWDADYKALMGERVTPTPHPSLSVVVNLNGRAVLTLPVSNPVHPRIDAVCTDGKSVRVVTGIPSARPVPPATPYGFAAIATVTVPPNATSVVAANIQGVSP